MVRINSQVLSAAGLLEPVDLRTLDAIHLATAALFEGTLRRFISYDERMTGAARLFGWSVASPS